MGILIIDDSPPVVRLLEATLQREGYDQVYTASSGVEALEFLGITGSREPQAIDLILLDIVMPVMDGIEVCKKIKNHDFYAETPVIMVTIRDEQEVLKSAFEAGASDYIVKPVRELELLARVGNAIRLKEEIERRKKKERQLQQLTDKLESANLMLVELSHTDDLTKVGNRRFFRRDMEKEWRRAIREKKPFSLLAVDVDYFREFGEEYGKAKADSCLKLVANILQVALKRAGDHLARYDGSEFAVFLPGTDTNGAIVVAESMRANVMAVQVANEGSKASEFVTISVGVAAVLPNVSMEVNSVFEYAAQALSRARQDGGNRVATYKRSATP